MSRRGLRRWRYLVAEVVNRLPGQCWADLVTWAFRGQSAGRLPWAPIGSTCRGDFERTGCCYCGKLRDPEMPDG